MSGRWKLVFPYLLFGAMALLVIGANLRDWVRYDPAGEVAAHRAVLSPDVCPIHGMRYAEGAGFTAQIDGTDQRFCNPDCEQRYREILRYADGAATANTRVDPVCKMQVNAAWGVSRAYQSQTFHFCTQRCRLAFAADPEAYVGERCPVCDGLVAPEMVFPATYLGRTYLLCSEDHRAKFKEDPARYFMHSMWGIPPWLYYAAIGMVLLVSFVKFEGLGVVGCRRAQGNSVAAAGAAPRPRFDLLTLGWVRRLARSRPFRFCAQFSMVVVFVLILCAGLFGDQNPALNLAPLLTWTIWWCGLVVVILFAGKAWCYVCPWDAIATWMERWRLWRKTDAGLGLALPWPRVLRNVWVATVLFVGLTWVELGFGVTMRPRATAYLGIGMLVLAIVSAFLFERKSFCRYGCLVGRVSGLYAMFSGLEVRRRDGAVCRSCAGKECVTGSATAYACPTFENPSRMVVNTYCIQCTECLQACPHDNLAVNLRPWGADLAVEGKPSADEAYLALLMLAITGFHGLTMTPAWPALLQWLDLNLGLGPVLAFTAGMTALMGLPLVLYAALIGVSHAVAGRGVADNGGAVSYRDYFVRYAYCVLPIALFYHLAHNLEHLLMEGPKIIRLASDPLGRGWNLFGTARWSIPPLASLDTLWILQVVLVGVGHVYSLWAAQKISQRTFSDPRAATRSQLPILVGMIAFSVFSLWLLKQPMEMRTSAM